MVDKRKSVSKHPYWHRRNRTSTSDLLCPSILIGTGGTEHLLLTFCFHTSWVQNYLFVHPCQQFKQDLSIQLARFGSSLSSVSPFISGYSSFVNPIVPHDSNLIPSNFGSSYIESGVVEDLSIRSTTQSVFPP